ncbi:hypothetical protein DPMN_044640 [Dreissena polymorpha]|uniref:Uncharacterized protein n=1 Tax=Dreissena polymorpha TaxID=45954 RepID=A0A9D4D4T2_DREPO|nr:hypothetical protein DPMN_044640 [Dreissena polymorpha]
MPLVVGHSQIKYLSDYLWKGSYSVFLYTSIRKTSYEQRASVRAKPPKQPASMRSTWYACPTSIRKTSDEQRASAHARSNQRPASTRFTRNLNTKPTPTSTTTARETRHKQHAFPHIHLEIDEIVRWIEDATQVPDSRNRQSGGGGTAVVHSNQKELLSAKSVEDIIGACVA